MTRYYLQHHEENDEGDSRFRSFVKDMPLTVNESKSFPYFRILFFIGLGLGFYYYWPTFLLSREQSKLTRQIAVDTQNIALRHELWRNRLVFTYDVIGGAWSIITQRPDGVGPFGSFVRNLNRKMFNVNKF